MTQRWTQFDQRPGTNPLDAECARTLAVLHVYVDLLRLGVDAPARHPRAAAHVVACDSCGRILQGIATAVREHDMRSSDL
ncbi:hypothetical protein [Microbacterium sp. NPDC058345]|uniref:hypothetical protein n=1 Tax=Microbacterium sp. NPDC058345 TaxID=3346455 RepID=UPI00365033ED